MEPIKIDFLDQSADGLCRLSTHNWAGACLVISRNRLESALKSGELAVPGVYILVGPSEVRNVEGRPGLISKLYIGKSDTLDERISTHSHSKSKEFWSTAFAFYHVGGDFHAGHLADLERLMIQKAKKAGNDIVDANVIVPRQHGGSNSADSAGLFLEHIEIFLKALGYDFFSVQEPSDVTVIEPSKQPEHIPENLQRLIGEIQTVCLELPSTEFYSTKVPDLRAKVISGGNSRIFARLQFLKHSLRLGLKGEPGHHYNLSAEASLDQNGRDDIKAAYSWALKQLAD
jgi:hypothetical protein